MDFLTEEQVKAEADKGKLAAMKCSLQHHEQGRDAEKVELINAIKDGEFAISFSLCACCSLQNVEKTGDIGKETCGTCPLGDTFCKGKGSIIHVLCDAIDEFELDYSNANFKAFQEAEAVLCKYIEGKIAEEEGKSKGKGECWTCKYQPLTSDKHPCSGCDKVACNSSNWEAKSKCKKDEPELVDGDFGIDTAANASYIVLGKRPYWFRDDCFSTLPLVDFDGKMGNLVADLERNSEDLLEFKMGDSGGDYDFEANLSGPHIRIQCCTRSKTGLYWEIDEVEEIHQKLGQLIATAKRQGSK